jgi:hypothetical protein
MEKNNKVQAVLAEFKNLSLKGRFGKMILEILKFFGNIIFKESQDKVKFSSIKKTIL